MTTIYVVYYSDPCDGYEEDRAIPVSYHTTKEGAETKLKALTKNRGWGYCEPESLED